VISRSPRLLAPLLLLISAARPVWAQPSETEATAEQTIEAQLPEEARQDYRAARVLGESEDFANARIKFQSAYEKSGHPDLLWNMARCEWKLRRYGSMMRYIARYEQKKGQLSESEREWVADVSRYASKVELTGAEPRANVHVDDEWIGETPEASTLYVGVGTHTIRVTQSGFRDRYITKTFDGNPETIAVDLVRLPSEARLTVTARGADVLVIDGHAVPGPRWEGTLRAGKHTLRIRAPGKLPYATEIVLLAGTPKNLDVQLTSEETGLPLAVWLGGGALVAGALGVGAYFLFKPEPTETAPTIGTISPGTVQIP
jgi:hypothetical protein